MTPANATVPRLDHQGTAHTNTIGSPNMLPATAPAAQHPQTPPSIPQAAHGVPLARSARSFFEGQQAVRRILTERDDLVQMIGWRLVVDTISRLTATQWEHRAAMLEDAMSRPGDYPGRSTPEERAVRNTRLAEDANRCRRHAQLLRSVSADETGEAVAW
ncbi:MAG TPA: hypothetical protein VHO26_06280 [Propionibacteriaceae bacterium]|nr:hypothetical protein [Propionibacteriaceae bacterium]